MFSVPQKATRLVSITQDICRPRRTTRLIAKWLTAGVLEGGRVIETEEGTPQGAVISPLLANIFLHHVMISGSTSGGSDYGRGGTYASYWTAVRTRPSRRHNCNARKKIHFVGAGLEVWPLH